MINGDLRPNAQPRVVEVRLSYTCIERTRDLRILSRKIEMDLRRLGNGDSDCKDAIIREEAALKAVCIEIRQRERLAFLSEFRIQ